MRSLHCLLSVALAAAALPAVAETPGLNADRLKLIRPRLQELVDNQEIPGAVALVARHGQVALLEAVGWRDVENRKPMTPDSIFQIMSMTKPFTSTAIMLLMEEGRIALSDPVEPLAKLKHEGHFLFRGGPLPA